MPEDSAQKRCPKWRPWWWVICYNSSGQRRDPRAQRPRGARESSRVPDPALRGRPLQRDNFPPAPRPLPIPRFSLARNPRVETRVAGLLDLRREFRAASGELEKPWSDGRLARGWECPNETAWQKTKRGGKGGTFVDFLGFLVGFQTCKDRQGRAPRVQKGEARHSKAELGQRAPSQSVSPPLPPPPACSSSRSRAPRTTCPLPRDVGGGGGPEQRRAGSMPCRTRGDGASSAGLRAAKVGPGLPPLPPPVWPSRRSPSRARSSPVGAQRLSCALSRSPAAPWSGSVFSAHHHVHQLVARVQQPRRPEGAAPAAAAGGSGYRQPPAAPRGPRGTAATGRIPWRGGPQGDSLLASLPATQPGDPAHLSLPPSPGWGGAVSRCHSEAGSASGPAGVGQDSSYLVWISIWRRKQSFSGNRDEMGAPLSLIS